MTEQRGLVSLSEPLGLTEQLLWRLFIRSSAIATGNLAFGQAQPSGTVSPGHTFTYTNAIAEIEQQIQIGDRQFHTRKVGDPLHEKREPREVLENLKMTPSSFNFGAQHQQCPVPPEGEIIKWDWFQFFDARPERVANDRIIQSWDTASKANELNDYSVCTSWLVQGNRYYLFDVLRERLDYPDLKRRVMAHAASHEASSVLIEVMGSETSFVQDISQENTSGMPNPIRINSQEAITSRLEWIPATGVGSEFSVRFLRRPKRSVTL